VKNFISSRSQLVETVLDVALALLGESNCTRGWGETLHDVVHYWDYLYEKLFELIKS